MAQRKLPMILLQEELRREKERTSQLIDKLRSVKNRTVQKVIKEYENNDINPLQGGSRDDRL